MEDLSKAKLRLFTSLRLKKIRQQHRLFLVEGKKMVNEALNSTFQVHALVISKEALDSMNDLISKFPDVVCYQTPRILFDKISTLSSPEGILAVVGSKSDPQDLDTLKGGFICAGINDPGNLGTIIRTADWFGMGSVICSSDTVDPYNPKTLRSTMGSIFRVEVISIKSLDTFLHTYAHRIWVADLKGKKPDSFVSSKRDFILLGNEANGVPDYVHPIPGLDFVSIPGRKRAESLNVGISAGILAYEMFKTTKNEEKLS